MSSNSIQQKSAKTSRWGSLLSGAVAGIESRLDNILVDENDTAAKAKAREAEAITPAAPTPTSTLDVSLSIAPDANHEDALVQAVSNGVAKTTPKKHNDRLQERLARAMASRSSSRAISEDSTPALVPSTAAGLESPRTSLESRPSIDITRPDDVSDNVVSLKGEELGGIGIDTGTQSQVVAGATTATDGVANPAESLLSSTLPINPARHSEDFTLRRSFDVDGAFVLDASRSSMESEGPRKSSSELEGEVLALRAEREESDRQKQEEMDIVLERIDALQAKLQYLANETVAAAKEANASAPSKSLQQQVADKDEKIALLMEEGIKLSKTEMRHLANIRKLSTKALTEEKSAAELRTQVAKLKQAETSLLARIARLELSDKENAPKLQRLAKAESDLTGLRLDLQSKETAIASLKRRLETADKKIESLESGSTSTSLTVDTRRINDLEEQLSSTEIEKKLALDRAKADVQRVTRELEQHQNKAQTTELELRTEISNLEGRMETLRTRAEEAFSDQAGDSQAKFIRQIETTQNQYNLAAENWRAIEASLNARLTAVEKERDETVKRETDLRKKARDLGVKCRKLEEELDNGTDKTSNLGDELSEQKALVKKLEAKLEASNKAQEDARIEFEQQRQMLESQVAIRFDEEQTRRVSNSNSFSVSHSYRGSHKRTPSPSSVNRKTSTSAAESIASARRPATRGFTNESNTSLSAFLDRPVSRRSSALPSDLRSPEMITSPTLSMTRKQSALSLNYLNHNGISPSIPQTPMELPPMTPSITTTAEGDEDFSHHSSPRGTIAADVISASTIHTGPSVALVERMSSSIRRLEAEKAAHKDETARLTQQRDEARDQLVEVMREMEGSKVVEGKVEGLQKEMHQLKERYEACLEMLGEKEEESEELKGDLRDMKRIYRELVDKMGHE